MLVVRCRCLTPRLRVLPNTCAVEINKNSWKTSMIFAMMQEYGNITNSEMFLTCNMGIGFVIIVATDNMDIVMRRMQAHPEFRLFEIGKKVISGHKDVRLI